MRFNIVTILLTIGAGASFVTAAPADNLVARKELQGTCSDGKCKYDGTLYACTLGGSCVGKAGQSCQGLSSTDKEFGCPE